MGLVSVKNHNHAAKNPYAHFQKGATLDEVLCSRMIAAPFRLFMCSPITDGAAAVIVASEERARDLTDRPSLDPRDRPGPRRLHALLAPRGLRALAGARSARAADQRTGWRASAPTMWTSQRVRDYYAIAEIIAYEELGFCAKGEGGRFVEKGLADYGGKVVVNPRGGLMGCGHPLGATGYRASVRSVSGSSATRPARARSPSARLALTHNNSGMGEHVVMLYGRD